MSSQGLPTLELDVRSRRAETLVAALAMMLAVAAPWLSVGLSMGPLPSSLTGSLSSFAFALSVAVAVVVPVGFRCAGWIGRQRQIIRIVWQADGRWFLTNAHGRTAEAVLRADTRISTRAIWLRWDIQLDRPTPRASTSQVSVTRGSMLLATGDVPEADLRRLFVRLRLDRSPPAAQLPTIPVS